MSIKKLQVSKWWDSDQRRIHFQAFDWIATAQNLSEFCQFQFLLLVQSKLSLKRNAHCKYSSMKESTFYSHFFFSRMIYNYNVFAECHIHYPKTGVRKSWCFCNVSVSSRVIKSLQCLIFHFNLSVFFSDISHEEGREMYNNLRSRLFSCKSIK